MDDNFKRVVVESKAAQAQTNTNHLREKAKKAVHASGGTPLAIEGPDGMRTRAAHIDKGLAEFDKVRDWLRCKVIEVADTRAGARTCIVDDPTSPGDRILWVTVLTGGYVTSPACLLSGSGLLSTSCPPSKSCGFRQLVLQQPAGPCNLHAGVHQGEREGECQVVAERHASARRRHEASGVTGKASDGGGNFGGVQQDAGPPQSSDIVMMMMTAMMKMAMKN